jgi:uncharacterized membrane protein
MKYLRNRPGLTSVAGVILLLLVLTVADLNAPRVMLALPLVLFLPGFALTVILFERERVGIPERLLLSLGLSVALTALIGLVLNWTPWGLQTTSLWAALLLGLAVEVAVIYWIRRLKWRDVISLPDNLNFTARQWILLSFAALVTMAAIHVARSPTRQQGFEGYTTLWIQPTETPGVIYVGVNSEEFEVIKYQIKFKLNGVIREGPSMELNPGENWQGILRLPSEELTGKALTVYLYRLDRPTEIYRHAVWWPETK